MRVRLRIVAQPAPPNAWGFTAFAFHIVTLPSEPDGEEVPFAATACILNLN